MLPLKSLRVSKTVKIAYFGKKEYGNDQPSDLKNGQKVEFGGSVWVSAGVFWAKFVFFVFYTQKPFQIAKKTSKKILTPLVHYCTCSGGLGC